MKESKMLNGKNSRNKESKIRKKIIIITYNMQSHLFITFKHTVNIFMPNNGESSDILFFQGLCKLTK